MGKTLYLECQTGISGDMTVAALLDLGADEQVLMKALRSLPVSGYRAEISRVKKSGLDVCDFNVILDEENHDHDMEYLYGHEKPEMHEHHHPHEDEHMHYHEDEHVHRHHHEAGHTHEMPEHHGHEHGHHAHRGLAEILDIIGRASLTDRARTLAVKIFTIIAEAEAKAHGTSVEEVHFHEVGAVDSIVDIVAAAVCLDNLDITDTIVTEVVEGHGSVRCAHGILPVPVPAVLHIAKAGGLPLHISDMHGELVTPTGAAILAAIMTMRRLPQKYRIAASGTGAGKRAYERPSLLRAMLIEPETENAGTENTGTEADYIWKLETNVDDCTGEALSFCMEALFNAGARDVYYSPIYMKKNRPAYELNVICDEAHRTALESIIFQQTTTIGIRRTRYERTMLPRTMVVKKTELGEIRIKHVTLPDGTERWYPEYEDAARIAREQNCSLGDVYALAEK